ncbi:MAG: FAD-dependent oxidoreductase [Desulfobacterota bacterium]|nr:FAD-dependent oxidoreductase [Thermodesulfobacteriota bacterium]MDW8001851.1 FAD-dependent oxidoreductase [Deltaproteobacteria bacterium]
MRAIFSSWQGHILDNRNKTETEYISSKIRLPEEFFKGEKIKAFFGWDGIVIFEEDLDLIDMLVAYLEAVQKESCGRCVPCSKGTYVVVEALKKIAEGKGKREDLDLAIRVAEYIRDSSKCSIGQTGLKPFFDILKYFSHQIEKCLSGERVGKKATYRYSVTAPCMSACPSGLDIPKYVEEIREGKFVESLMTIRNKTCLPGTLGRVCVRPCEENCRRALVDEPVSIKWLKRFAADYEIETNKEPLINKNPTNGKRIAVIGAGPAGLSCAYYLAIRGYRVKIFERLNEAGGMAAFGIPDYRLPREILRREVDIIRRQGVEIEYNVTVGKDVTISELKKEFDAIFIGVGAQTSTKMGVEGEDRGLKGFIPGIKYLYDINCGIDPYPEGKKVVVVGGGNVAIDCVRTSFRIGKTDVNLVYRRSRAEMPADPHEIKDAEAEGVKFHFLCNPVRILERDGRVTGVELIRMELGEPDESGRRRPVPVPGSEFVIETDILIPAIGQAIDLSFLDEKDGVNVTKRGTIYADPETFLTTREGVFAAGDCVTGPDVLVRAAGNGRRAAEMIDLYLRGKELRLSEEERFVRLFADLKVFDKDEKLEIPAKMKRIHLRALDPEVRKWVFDEVEEGYRPDEALYESMRCLRCYRIGMVAV